MNSERSLPIDIIGSLGVVRDDYDERDYIKRIPNNFQPTSIDLTKGLDVRIKDQDRTSACTGFSSAYLMSILYAKLIGEWVDFDPWFIYYNARNFVNAADQNVGVNYRIVLKCLGQYGCLTSDSTDLFGYTMKPSDDDFNNASSLKLRSFFRIPNDNMVNGMLYTLVKEKLPVIVCMDVFDRSYPRAGSNGILKNVEGDELYNAHAVCVYGYDADKDMFLALNSHGRDWGINGRFKITRDYLERNAFDIWTVGYNYF